MAPTLEHLFVSYELALELKNIGFDEPCIRSYDNDNENSSDKKFYLFEYISSIGITTTQLQSNKGMENFIGAPLYQQVIDWLRDEKYINIQTHYDYITYDVIIYDYKNSQTIKLQSTLMEGAPYCFTDYYEALNEAIKEALKLIK